MFYQKKEKKQEVDVAVLLINDTSANIHNTIDNSNPGMPRYWVHNYTLHSFEKARVKAVIYTNWRICACNK